LLASNSHAQDQSSKEVVPTPKTNLQSAKQFSGSVKPLLAKYCFTCHGPKKQESEFRIDELDPNLVEGQHGGKWREVLDALNRGDMPPEEALQPSATEREQIIDWMSSELNRAAELRRSTGGHVVMRRLTRYEYNNTMRDLLGIEMDYASELPPDSRGIDGYKNNGQFLGMSELQLEEYYKAAKRGLAAAIVQGEQPKRIHQKITEGAKGVRNDSFFLAPFDKEIGGTVIGAGTKDQKSKKGGAKKNTMILLCLDKLPLTGNFRVRIAASSTPGDSSSSPPRMMVTIGHKTGALVEPKKTLAQVDVDAELGAPLVYEFVGRLEEFPLHIGKTIKKFPGLRIQITDMHASVKRPAGKEKDEPQPQLGQPELVVYSIEFETPVDQAWPPNTHAQILPSREEGISEQVYLESVLHNFITRAYRRPAQKEEVDWAIRYYNKLRPETETFEDAVQEVLTLVLMSPKFLYLPEFQTKKASEKKIPLDEYELASRLSYFLWGTMPDQQLQDLSQQGKLSHNSTLAKQTERMMTDEKSWQFVESFAGQWLDLDGVDAVAVNPEYFPKFDNSLKEDMKQESLHFFAEVLHKKMSCLNFIDSDFTMLNDRLAEFYGMDKPKSGHFQKVTLPPNSVRGGVLTQASFLLGNSTGAEGHPIYRAKWFLDRVMGEPPGDPPADVPELDEESPNLKDLSLTQKLELHRKLASCKRCHKNLDPWGIPFEGFNGIGQFTNVNLKKGEKKERAVEDTSTLPDGTEVKGSKELVAYLLKNQKDKFAQAFCKHVLTFALSRSLEWTDQPLVDQLAADFQANGYKMDRLISKIVQSDAFKTK
jgi:hypothetical protein